ncbi:MAG TPA: hypothetical protein VNB06_07800 [Thermoanaerobaculia bacterium]|nr:hypothetical protein [Thermoanaerobaculia bacterium]
MDTFNPPDSGSGHQGMNMDPRSPPNRPSVLVRLITVALALNLSLLLVYLALGAETWFNSDAAIKSVLAEEILRTGQLFPRDFTYANGDIWIIHGHLLLLVLIPLFGNSLLSNALSSLLFSAALLYTVALFLRRTGHGVSERRLTLLWVATGLSNVWAAMMYGQAAYGYVVLVTVWSLWATIDCLLPKSISYLRLLALIASAFLIGCYGTRGLLSIALPIAAAITFGTLYGSIRPPAPGRTAVALLALSGGLIWRQAMVSRLRFADFQGSFVDRARLDLTLPIDSLVQLFGLFPDAPVPLSEPSLAIFPLRLLMLAVLVGATAVATIRYSSVPPERQLLLGFFWTLTLVSLYLLASVPNLQGQGRYLVVPTFIAILLGSHALHDLHRSRAGLAFLSAFCVALLTLSYFAFALPALPRASRTATLHLAGMRDDGLEELISALRALSVETAYATYWHSTVATVRASGHVQIYPIKIENGVPRPFHHLSLGHWYLPYGKGPVALVVTPTERTQLNTQLLAEICGNPDEEISIGGYTVWVFREDRFSQLPGWQRDNFERGVGKKLIFTAQDVYTQQGVGRIEADALVSTGTAGALVYGPYLDLAAGHFRVTIRYQSLGQGTSPGRWDIASRDEAGEHVILDQGAIMPTPELEEQLLERILTVPRSGARDLEVRLFASGHGEIRFRDFEIERCAAPASGDLQASGLLVRAPSGSSISPDLPPSCGGDQDSTRPVPAPE